jgi:predicted SnoaL-like aldol condensation-catalyzing enzyme
MKTALVGIVITALLAYKMHSGQDWSAGAGKTPRVYVADYLDMAYTQGMGVEAAQKYFLPTTVDHSPDSADRSDGPPIKHEIREIIADGMTVAVYHHIEAARNEAAMDVVDIYKTKKGRIVERQRVSQR